MMAAMALASVLYMLSVLVLAMSHAVWWEPGAQRQWADLHPTFSSKHCGSGVCLQARGSHRRWVDVKGMLGLLQAAHHLFAYARRLRRPAAAMEDDGNGIWWRLSVAQKAVEGQMGWVDEALQMMRVAFNLGVLQVTVITPTAVQSSDASLVEGTTAQMQKDGRASAPAGAETELGTDTADVPGGRGDANELEGGFARDLSSPH